MNIVYLIGMIATMLVSCSSSYNITGTITSASLQSYDGDMVYLRMLGTEEGTTVNSCKVLHGDFKMSGPVDSVICVKMYFGQSGDYIPIIIEEGEIKVSALTNAMKVEGTPLNDKFYAFMTERDSLMFLLDELPRKENAMISYGYDNDEILRMLGEEEGMLRIAVDQLETEFVMDNYDNVLGITYFLMLCDNIRDQFGFFKTTPQIKKLYNNAPEEFKRNRNVEEYMRSCDKQTGGTEDCNAGEMEKATE